MSVLLDTTVFIDVLRGHVPAARYLEELNEVPCASELARVEVIAGLRSAERTAAEQLFRALEWIPVGERLARDAGDLGRRYRRSHVGIGAVDLVIAATALALGLPIATTNTKHYPMFPDLRPPYRV